MDFKQLGVIPPLDKALVREGFSIPTEIQEKAIPYALEGRDIIGSAQTGSGKTLAFALPTLQNIYNGRLLKGEVEGKIKRKIQSLILAPTRELAIQIGEAFKPYCTNTNLKHTVIYGGVNQFHQVKALEKGVDILIATPGRLEDLISQGLVKLSYVEIFTLDEVDRMLEVGALADIKKILKRLPEKKQSFFFSATMPKVVVTLAEEILNNPEKITVHTNSSTTDTIEQQVYHLNKNYKRQLLQQIIKRKDLKSIIVFTNTQESCEKVHEYVKSANVACDHINRKKTQNQRQKALQALKDGDIKVLIATDIASRGLDVSRLSCVINLDIPGDAETYVHRVGRTGRAGEKGLAISFCTTPENEKLKAIEKLIGKKLDIIEDDSYKKVVVPKGKTEKTIQILNRNKPRGKKKHYGKK